MSDYLHCENTPVLDTPRLLLRPPVPADVPDLAEWLGLDEVYTYWGRKASGGEKNPASLFIDARPHVKRKPGTDRNWMLVLRETGKVIGQMEVFHVENGRMADVRNTGSNRVLEKCGFVREGTVRQGKMVSVYCDYHIYGLLKSDWDV